MRTKRTTVLVGLVSLLGLAQWSVSEEPKRPETVKQTAKKQGVALTAEAEKKAAAGGPYLVTLTVVNGAKQPVALDVVGFLKGFEIKIVDGERKAVPHTRFLRNHLAALLGRGKLKWLKPGEATSREFNLARLFDLSEKGTYHATISRKVRTGGRDGQAWGSMVVEIGKLTLTVREPTGEDYAKWR